MGEDMKYLVELPVDGPDGRAHVVGVEIEQAAEGLVKVSRPGQVVARAAHSLGEMLAAIRPVADSFAGGFAGMANAPDEIGLEFGLSLSADANLVVATSAAQANFKVALTWSRPGPEAGPAATGGAA
jgi:Trypsin-co-occurring domain 1